jgi:hypothetical protein
VCAAKAVRKHTEAILREELRKEIESVVGAHAQHRAERLGAAHTAQVLSLLALLAQKYKNLTPEELLQAAQLASMVRELEEQQRLKVLLTNLSCCEVLLTDLSCCDKRI